MFIIITNDDGTVIAREHLKDDAIFNTALGRAQDAIFATATRRAKGEIDRTAGIYLPTGYVHVVEDGDGDPAVFADPDDAQAYANTYGDRSPYERLVCDGKVAREMIGDGT